MNADSTKISAVIVTRGDVDLGPCLSSIDADEVVIRKGHGGVWERWEAVRAGSRLASRPGLVALG